MNYSWIQDNFLEIFGAITGIVYVFLEIRQNIWLWPVGLVTSAVYIWLFFVHKFYADMSLQVYYMIISILGWYWWMGGKKWKKTETEKAGMGGEGNNLQVTRLQAATGIKLGLIFVFLYAGIWLILLHLTDSPVPGWDSFITSLSIVATWMLARKIYEHWYLWIVVNAVSVFIFMVRGLYPTVLLYLIYAVMSFAGLAEWKKSIKANHLQQES